MTERELHNGGLSKADAAKALDVTVRTIERYIAAGELVAYRVGKAPVRITRESFDAFTTPVIVSGRGAA